jgi:beta-barrel assembly-enhancing protease
MYKKIFLALVLCASVFCSFGNAQDCAPPAIVANARSSNLFSPEQETMLGELVIQHEATDKRFIRDENLTAYINDIGGRLIKHLPATGLKFQFHIVDMPQTNAFNIPGGHVMLTRKLIAFAANEDEIAGVIAHELGHGVVRHGALDISELLRKILNVTSLGDRKDITEKYNLLIERARTKRILRGRGHEDEQQLEADKIGLFAMVAAGYDPAAFFSFFDRLTESQGKTGNWFSDLFGSLRPAEKRLREMLRATEQMPAACSDGRSARATESFLKWQADVVSFREAGRKEELPGLIWKKELKPKLQSDISHLAFSPDGKHILAQDDFSITIIEREPLRTLFQIPADNAREAAFTQDGKFVVFTTENLRYEKWGVAERKLVESRELVLRRNCWEHKLAPDGNYLACVDTLATVNILDTRTGKKIWEQKEFYRLSYMEFFARLGSSSEGSEGAEGRRYRDRTNFFRIEFSPDSRYVMFSRSDRFRYRIRENAMTVGSSQDTALALDLTTLNPIKIGSDLKNISARPYIFLDSERILGTPAQKSDESGVFTFPDGKRLQRFTFAARQIKRTENPNYIIIKPLAEVKMGVFDFKKGILASGLNKEDAALWNNLMVYESTKGKLLLREVIYNEDKKNFDSKDIGMVEIPVGSIKNLAAAEISDGFKWLLMSSRTRGGLWNLETGDRKLYVRGFKGGVIDQDGLCVSEFPTLDDMRHSLVLMNPHKGSFTPVLELPEKGARQYGRFVLLRRSLRARKEEKKTQGATADEESESLSLSREARFELKDFLQDKIIWSRDFPKEAPAFSFDSFSGRLILYWSLGSGAGKDRLKELPELQAKATALGNKDDDYLVEIIDSHAQKTVGTMLLETGEGSFNIGKGLSEQNWLVLRDSEGRVLIYSIKDGDLPHRFFGAHAAINPANNQIAVENFPGEITLYNLDTGDRHATFVINGSAAFVRFNLEGDKLFVLSDTQSVYAFDLNRLAAKATEAK